jgi:hypothetical protein
MERALNALVHLDIPDDTVRIDVAGTLDHESRPDLVHIIRRIRRMGIRSHIRVDLSRAALIESSALAGLRRDLTAMDIHASPGVHSPGVSLQMDALAGLPPVPAPGTQPLVLVDDDDPFFPEGFDSLSALPQARVEELFGRPLADYTDKELLAASDSLFTLLDTPRTLAGPELLGRYNDIGREIIRRQREPGQPFPAAEGRTAS